MRGRFGPPIRSTAASRITRSSTSDHAAPTLALRRNVGCGSFASVWRCPRHFRFTPDSRPSSEGSARPKRARRGSRRRPPNHLADYTAAPRLSKFGAIWGHSRGHSPIRAIVYAKEPDFLNKDCQIKSTDTKFRRCLFSLRGIGTNRLFVLFRRSGFFYSQYAGHGREQSKEALTSLEVGQFTSRLDSLLLNVPYRTNSDPN
jgi:hypothetical protein